MCWLKNLPVSRVTFHQNLCTSELSRTHTQINLMYMCAHISDCEEQGVLKGLMSPRKRTPDMSSGTSAASCVSNCACSACSLVHKYEGWVISRYLALFEHRRTHAERLITDFDRMWRLCSQRNAAFLITVRCVLLLLRDRGRIYPVEKLGG